MIKYVLLFFVSLNLYSADIESKLNFSMNLNYNVNKICTDEYFHLIKESSSEIDYNYKNSKYNNCVIEVYKKQAKSAKYDFVSDLKLNELYYSDLPYIECDISLTGIEEIEYCESLTTKELNLKTNTKIPFKVIEPEVEDDFCCVLYDEMGNSFLSVEFLYYRDVNLDGYMDIIARVDYTQGSANIPSILIFSKKNKDSRMVLLRDN